MLKYFITPQYGGTTILETQLQCVPCVLLKRQDKDKKNIMATPYAEGNKKFCERHICMVPDKKEPQYPEKNHLKSIKKPSTILYQPLEFFAQLILHN